MKKLVVGANGFIAKNICIQLAHSGEEVIKVDLTQSSAGDVVVADLSDYGSAKNLLDHYKPDQVYNLAGTFSNNFAIDEIANFRVPKNILDAVHELHLKCRIVLFGSAAEYGAIDAEDNPVKETQALHPISIYGFTKSMQSTLMEYYFRTKKVDVLMARPFNIKGRDISEKLFVGRVYKQIAAFRTGNTKEIVVGRLDTRRDYIAIEDAVKRFELIMENGMSGQTYNVGSGFSVSMHDLLKEILLENGLDMDIVKTGEANRSSDADVMDIYADVSKVNSLQRN